MLGKSIFAALITSLVLITAAPDAEARRINQREQAELDRTWNGGLMFVPSGDRFEWGTVDEMLPRALEMFEGQQLPVVIYSHGCSGIDIISRQAGRDHSIRGYVVFAPDSFARSNKPQSCNVATHQASLHRDVIFWRQNEINNAIRMARALPFVDGDNVFVHGFSEGAITAATFEGEPVNARVVEGWTCHAGWVEYAGINAPSDEPVLSLVSRGDPWFQRAWNRGNCGRYINNGNGSESVVLPGDHMLGHEHYLSWHPDIQERIFDFIDANSR